MAGHSDPRVHDPSVAAFTARRRDRARQHQQHMQARREQSLAAQANKEKPVRARNPKRLALGALVGAASLLVTSCGFTNGLYGVPLPGGADLGSNPMTLHVRMNDVYDLVPQAAVKYRDVTIGKVTEINLANKQQGKWQADVTIQTNRAQTQLPGSAMGQLRQTSLLGEKFVELVATPGSGGGAVADNAQLSEDPEYNHVEVEQILGALSLLLNNGGLPQIRTISQELSKAMSGREGDIKGLLHNVTTLVSTLDQHSGDIIRAIDNVNKLSATLNAQKDKLVGAIDNLSPGLRTLRDQRGQLVNMLKAMQRLSGVTVDTINKSRDDMVADLQSLEPTLRKLSDSGDDLTNSLPLLLTIPFGDYAAGTVRGDYDNLYANVDLDLSHVIQNLGRSRQNLVDQVGLLPPGQNSNQPGTPDAGTGSGVYPNDPDYGKAAPQQQSAQPQQQQQQQPQQQQAQPQQEQGQTPSPNDVGPNAPSQGGTGGLGGIFGTLSGGGAF